MTDLFLAVDAGTTGVTSLAFDAELRPVARAYAEFPQHFPRPGWVEHRAEEILAAVDATLSECLAGARGAVRSLGITNQRETVFACDRGSGAALAPGIVWQDRRTAERCRALREAGEGERVRARSGLLLDPYFSATKVEWLLANVTDLRARAERGAVVFATVDGLIARHLCGEWVTDPTNASRTMLYDLDGRGWSDELCALFGVDPGWLPAVQASAAVRGEARLPGGVCAPLAGVLGDQQAALYGQGCWDAGQSKNTYGTGCFLVLNTGARRVDSTAGLLTTLAATRAGSVAYALEGSVFAGGLVVQWLRDQLGLFQTAAESEELARSVPDSAGVFLVPAFAGLGAPYWDPDARGALLGLTRGAGRGHIARAALEGIAFQCAELVELFRSDAGLAVDELLVDGGATANDLLMQLQADLAGLTVLRSADVEATARGAAAIAAVGAGALADPGTAEAFRSPPRRFEPELDAGARAARLAEWRAAVARVRS